MLSIEPKSYNVHNYIDNGDFHQDFAEVLDRIPTFIEKHNRIERILDNGKIVIFALNGIVYVVYTPEKTKEKPEK